MRECTNLESCSFFDLYQKDEDKKIALKGFVIRYCKGNRQDQCIRRQLIEKLGEIINIPPNMLPNGHPAPGADKSSWSNKIKNFREDNI